MPTALRVIGGLFKEAAVVMIEHEVFAFVAHDVGHALEIMIVFGDDERARVEREGHAGGIDVAALIVDAARVRGRDVGHVGRVCAGAIARAVVKESTSCSCPLLSISYWLRADRRRKI